MRPPPRRSARALPGQRKRRGDMSATPKGPWGRTEVQTANRDATGHLCASRVTRTPRRRSCAPEPHWPVGQRRAQCVDLFKQRSRLRAELCGHVAQLAYVRPRGRRVAAVAQVGGAGEADAQLQRGGNVGTGVELVECRIGAAASRQDFILAAPLPGRRGAEARLELLTSRQGCQTIAIKYLCAKWDMTFFPTYMNCPGRCIVAGRSEIVP